MTTNPQDLYARIIYRALTEGRSDCRTWDAMTDNRREMYRRAADAVEAEMRRTVRSNGRVVGMRPRTAVAMEETGA